MSEKNMTEQEYNDIVAMLNEIRKEVYSKFDMYLQDFIEAGGHTIILPPLSLVDEPFSATTAEAIINRIIQETNVGYLHCLAQAVNRYPIRHQHMRTREPQKVQIIDGMQHMGLIVNEMMSSIHCNQRVPRLSSMASIDGVVLYLREIVRLIKML